MLDWDDMDSPYWQTPCLNCGGTRGFDHEYKQRRCLNALNDTKTITFTVFKEEQ